MVNENEVNRPLSPVNNITTAYMPKEIIPITPTEIIPQQQIESLIYTVRGVQVMLDRDLAMLYHVETKHLNRQVKRNPTRFPEDFMFQLTKEEWESIKPQVILSHQDWKYQNGTSKSDDESLRCQNVTSKYDDEITGWIKMGVRRMPYVFTEEGVGQLSSVLKSETAALISVRIQRAFVAMRRYITQNAGLFQRIESLEAYRLETKQEFRAIGERFDQIMDRLDDGSTRVLQGVFFDNQMFDALALLEELVEKAQTRIILIDDYVDARILKLFHDKSPTATIDCYVKHIHQTATMQSAFTRFHTQHPTIHCQLHTFELSHDRWLILDDQLYNFGASLKDLGKRWFSFALINDPGVKAHILNVLSQP